MKIPDQHVLSHIEALVAEEHRLFERGELAPEDSKRLKEVQAHLDQCWDLLRQRRARRSAGEDPDGAAVRDAGTVEGYRQ